MSKAPTFLEAAQEFVYKNHAQANGMLTTATLPVREGKRRGSAQFKWHRDRGMLIIKTVDLLPRGGAPKRAVTKAAKALVEDTRARELGLRAVVLESILSDELVAKLKAAGWHSYGAVDTGNLVIVAPGSCYFCGGDPGQHGNSCEPLASAPWRCCDVCNMRHVVTERIIQAMYVSRSA